MWPDTLAKMKYKTRYGKGVHSEITLEARIRDLSAQGMMVLTENAIPNDTEIELDLHFSANNGINATGKVLRTESNGVVILFTEIDTAKLGECIVKRLNSA